MTEADLDRVHADLLLAKKRVSADIEAATNKLNGMLREWNSATAQRRSPILAVNDDGRLIDNQHPAHPSILPTEAELIEAVKSYTDLRGRLDTIERKIQRFS